jgi:phosphatidylglycerol:prolipoprotein diacylglycerol transferase
LRWRRLPVRDVLDAWAPCGALLAAVLSIAHFVEGTDAGMPTRLPWGVVTPGDSVLGRVHPVQIYAAITALAICFGLLRKLQKRKFAGEVAALAMMTGGTGAFLLDMLRQPVESFGASVLDPGQFVALAAMFVGAVLFATGHHAESSSSDLEAVSKPMSEDAGRPDLLKDRNLLKDVAQSSDAMEEVH